jgi:hypothetical protein
MSRDGLNRWIVKSSTGKSANMMLELAFHDSRPFLYKL